MARPIRLTTSIIKVMLGICLLFCLQAGIGLTAAFYSIGDAQAINDSGSLRMRSYQLLHLIENDKTAVADKLIEFEQVLYSPALSRSTDWYMSSNSAKRYQQVVQHWARVKTLALAGDLAAYTQQVQPFVANIDAFVRSIERFNRHKLALLITGQLLGLCAILLLGWYALSYIREQFVLPLQRLEQSAEAIAERNFQVQPTGSRYQELNTLASTLTHTAAELDRLYRQLENKVVIQDLALHQANGRLLFLYSAAKTLSHGCLTTPLLTRLLTDLKLHLNADGLSLTLIGEQPLQIAQCQAQAREIALGDEENNIGQLAVYSANSIDDDLLNNFALLLGQALLWRKDQLMQEQLGLMEERAVIARELHDSLGQLLAYMKIQLTLLQRAVRSQEQSVIGQAQQDLKHSVDSAYQQLRELLSAFRLKVGSPDLATSLAHIIDEFQPRTTAMLTLDYQLPPLPFSAAQQLHLLQLLREAVNNACKHAQARHIVVHASYQDGQFVASVDDDGVGMLPPDPRSAHFGLNIMQERADKMGAILSIAASDLGGVQVKICLIRSTETDYD